MKKILTLKIAILTVSILALSSCMDKLNLEPKYGLNSTSVYNDPANYIHVLAKIYGGLNLTGNKGPAGSPDFGSGDEGFTSYIRAYWNLQELPTDEAVCGWTDPGIPELNTMEWSSDNGFVKSMYYRIYFQITMCNEFINASSDDNLAAHGFSDSDVNRIVGYRNEARFVRALAYYHQLDLFGTGPFVDENSPIGNFFPQQISRGDLFNYIEKELLSLQDLLPAPKQNEYGRADQAAVWSLLAKLYLNAQVYTGTARYTDCTIYCDKVIKAGYALDADYKWLFLADNHQSTEIIFPITSDGLKTQSYGCTTFLTHAAIGGSMPAAEFGVNGGWAGLRTRSPLVTAFGADTTVDARSLFYTNGQSLEINSLSTFTDGYAIKKYKNMTRAGVKGSDPSGNFVDTDYPLFRLGEIYLTYAEAVLRGGSAVSGSALDNVNLLRTRANAPLLTSVNLDDLLNERARELYWECTRRTDLIRYGKFTGGNYLWPFKGGVQAGVSVPEFLNLFPIPSSDLAANTNLKQNPGY